MGHEVGIDVLSEPGGVRVIDETGQISPTATMTAIETMRRRCVIT